MASYPYPPTYYPPAPPVVVQQPPVVYGAPPPVVHTTTVVHKQYGHPSFGKGGSSHGYPSYKGYKSHSKKHGYPSSGKKTINLINIKKSGSSSSSSKKPKASGSGKKSKLPGQKKKKRTGQKKTGARLREMPQPIGDLVGPQLSVHTSDAYVLQSLFDKIKEMAAGADSAVHRFRHAMLSLYRSHGKTVPVANNVPLDLHYMVSKAMHLRAPMQLTFVNEQSQRFESAPARPVVDNERTATVAFSLPSATKTMLNGTFTIEIAYGGRTFKHSDVFAESPRTIHGKGETFQWMINLYERAYTSAYYKYLVPIPTLELVMTRSRTEENVYYVSQAALVVDFEPRKHFSTLPARGSDVVRVPELLPRTHMPYKAYMVGNVALQRAIHGQLESRLEVLMSDTPNKWDFRCSVGARESQEGADHRVFLGAAGEAAVAYAILAMLADKQMLDQANDPAFIKEVLGRDPNGARALEVVAALYDKYHAAQGKARTSAHQDFPSLLQLLAHTSGLPASRSLNCEQVRAYYLKVIGVLSGSDDGSAPELPYDRREQLVLEQFATAPGADNDADVEVGPTHNTLEAFLLAMFVRRFSVASPMATRAPSDIVNSYLRPGDFKLEWGASMTGASQALLAADPLVFATCATATFSGLTSHVRMLTEELAQQSRADSIFFRMLSTRIRVAGDYKDVAHSVGWMQRRINEKLDVLYTGSRNGSVDTVVAVIVPQLGYFAVFHEMSADFDRPLQSSVDAVVGAVVETLNAEGIYAQYSGIPDRVRLSVARPSRANKTWDISFMQDLPKDFAVGAALPDKSVRFVNPFVVQTQRRLRTVIFDRQDASGVEAALDFSTGEHVPLVYDPRRGGYFERLYESEDSALGQEVVVTPEYIQYAGDIFIRQEEFEAFSRDYLAAYGTAMQLANADVFRTKLSTVIRQGTLVTLTPDAAFSLERKIGGGVGPALGGLAAGTVLGMAASRAWGPLGPGYPYGYPYGYPPYGVAVPVYYGPGGYWGGRRAWRRRHHF